MNQLERPLIITDDKKLFELGNLMGDEVIYHSNLNRIHERFYEYYFRKENSHYRKAGAYGILIEDILALEQEFGFSFYDDRVIKVLATEALKRRKEKQRAK